MNIKRILFLLVLVLLIIGGINIMGSYQKPEFKGVKNLSVVPLGDNGYRFTGTLEVYNPSFFQLRLSAATIAFKLNNTSIGQIDNPINLAISSKETGSYPFEVRFEKSELQLASQEPITANIKGSFSNSSLFSKLNIEIDKTETLSIK